MHHPCIRLGIIGCGRFAQRRILPLLSSFPFVQCVALHNRHLSLAKQITDSYDIPFFTNIEKDVIEHPEIDALIICSPNYLHKNLVMKALSKGLPTYVEKPFTLNFAEAVEISQNFPNAPLWIGHCYRFKSVCLEAKKHIQNSLIGSIKHISLTMHMSLVQKGWRFCHRYGGGATLELGSHLIDALHFFSDKLPSSLMAQAQWIRDDEREAVDHTLQVMGKLDDEITFDLSASFDRPYHTGFIIEGTQGRLTANYAFRGDDDDKETLIYQDLKDNLHSLTLNPQNIYKSQLDHFFKIVKGNKKLSNLSSATSTMRILDAIQLSCHKNKTVQLDALTAIT